MDYAKKTSPFSYSCGMPIDTGELQGIDEGFFAYSIYKQHANNGILSLCAFRINVIPNGMYGGVGGRKI